MKQNSFNKNSVKEYRINEEITYPLDKEVRLIGEIDESKVVTFSEATKYAEKNDFDLIEINASVTPPILRVASYEKFMYEQKKNAKKNKNTTKPLKEIDLSVNIAENDIETKAKKAKGFIEDGSKVKVVLTMKGRELSRRDINKKSIFEFIDKLSDVAVPEAMPKDEGNRTIVILKKKS